MPKKRRRWETGADDDPLAGMVNLFDLWMVFSIAVLLALVSYFDANKQLSTELVGRDVQMLTRYRVSREKLTGEGQRLGTAYRLTNGEVVYVPD